MGQHAVYLSVETLRKAVLSNTMPILTYPSLPLRHEYINVPYLPLKHGCIPVKLSVTRHAPIHFARTLSISQLIL